MSKPGVKVIAIAYAIALIFAYVVRHPPGWMAGITVTAGANRSIELFGHRIEVSVDVTRAVPATPLRFSPLREVWLETPVTIWRVPSSRDAFTYHLATDSAGVAVRADGR